MQLAADNTCRLFGSPQRPAVCGRFEPSGDVCGTDTEDALRRLHTLEVLTAQLIASKQRTTDTRGDKLEVAHDAAETLGCARV